MRVHVRSFAVFLGLAFLLPAARGEDVFSYEVTVRAQQEKADSVFDAESIAVSNTVLPGQGLGDVLSGRSGLEVTTSGYPGSLTTVSVRGGSSSQSLICVEDIPLNSAQDGVFDLALFNPGLFSGIETVKGGSSSVFGANAAAGYLNLILPPIPEATGIEYGSLLGSYARNRNMARLDARISRNFGMTVSALYDSAKNDFPYAVAGSNYTRVNSAFANGHAALSAFWSTPSWKSTLRAIYSHKDTGAPGLSPTSQDPQAFQKDDDALLIFRNVLYLPLYTEATFSWLYHSMLYDDDLWAVHSVHLNDQLFGHLSQMADLLGFSLGYGLEVKWNGIRSSSVGRKDRLLGSQFLSVQRHLLGKKLKLSARYRYEYSSVYRSVFNYNAGFNWRLPAGFTLRGNYGTAFREPTFNDLFWPEDPWSKGNPSLKPETSRSAEMGIENGYFGFAECGISGFYNRYGNLIIWSTNGTGGKSMPQNVNKADFYGAEASLSVRFGGFAGVSANYTRLYPVNRVPGPASGKFVPYLPLDRVNLGIEAKWRIVSLAANYHYTGFSFTTEANDPSMTADPRDALDLSLAVKIHGVTASVSALNVLRTAYFSPYGQPMMGRTVNVELKYRGSIVPPGGQDDNPRNRPRSGGEARQEGPDTTDPENETGNAAVSPDGT
jgi:outer membrane cobalamin receptor